MIIQICASVPSTLTTITLRIHLNWTHLTYPLNISVLDNMSLKGGEMFQKFRSFHSLLCEELDKHLNYNETKAAEKRLVDIVVGIMAG